MFEYTGLENTLIENFVAQLDLSPVSKARFLSESYHEVSGNHSGSYYHENCCSHRITLESNGENLSDWISSYEEQFEKFVIAEYVTLCRKLYSDLESDYELLTSDEQVAEAIIMNEWEFDEDGNNFR